MTAKMFSFPVVNTNMSLNREFTTEEKRLLAVAAIGTRRRSAVMYLPTDPEEADNMPVARCTKRGFRRVRVIVCGGRDYADLEAVRTRLKKLPITATIVHGAAKGADTLAHKVALECGFRWEAYPAQWKLHGRAAGPIRNERMLKLGADLVIAFPGGNGTAHMKRIAREAGIAVEECG